MPTRFYFPADTAADVSPAYDAGWNYAAEALRRALANVKGSSAITTGTQVGPWTSGNKALDRQYVSNKLAAQRISGTCKMQLMVREYADTDNVAAIYLCVKVVSEDGSTVRGTLLSLNYYAGISEFINNATHRNKKGADGDAMSDVDALDGDRIVVEIGYSDAAGAAPEASAKWGENASDLPEDEIQTTDGAGWIEFSGDLSFYHESKSVDDSGTGDDAIALANKISLADSGSGDDQINLNGNLVLSDSGSGADSISVADAPPPLPPAPVQSQDASTRTVEVIRVGSIGFERDYPGKLVVRLRDLSGIYDSDKIQAFADAKALAQQCKTGTMHAIPAIEDADGKTTFEARTEIYRDPLQAAEAALALVDGIDELFALLKGKRLAGINVEVFDQISGVYLGALNTDRNGTLVLPTDTQFCEVLQWRLNGGGYSDHFNGERSAGTPGLEFYFPCDEYNESQIASFSGVSGQKADWDGDWYSSGFFNRPALRAVSTKALMLIGLDPQGHRGFQFLWYCNDASENSTIFSYAQGKSVSSTPCFILQVASGVLKACAGTASATGTTSLEDGKWYLIQVNTKVIPTGIKPTSNEILYSMQIDVYLGGTLEATASMDDVAASGFIYGVIFAGSERDGFDELRHLGRNLDSSEIVNYAVYLKNGRYPGMSNGSLGTPGW